MLCIRCWGALLATQDQWQHGVPAAQGRGGRNCWIDVCYQSQACLLPAQQQTRRKMSQQTVSAVEEISWLVEELVEGETRSGHTPNNFAGILRCISRCVRLSLEEAAQTYLSKNPASNVRAAETLDTELNQGGTSETTTTNTNTEQMTWEGGHKYCSIYQSINGLA